MTVAVYVSNGESGDIHVLHLVEATGALTTAQRVEIGGTVMPLALSPDRRVLYAARRSEPLAVLSFAIDSKSGALTLLGEAPLPHSMANIGTDRSGRWLLSASYGGHLVAVSAVSADGVAQAATQTVPTGPNAHSIVTDLSNRFVFATSLGAGAIHHMHFDVAGGRLTPNRPAQIVARPGGSPRHLVWHAQGSVLYAINELDAAIDAFALDPERGTLAHLQTISGLPPGFDGQAWAADLHLTPDGRFLYASERRSHTLAAFAVEPSGGRLSLIGHTPTQAEPRGFNITLDGRWLIAAGQASHRVGVYRIEPRSGALEPLSEHAVGRGPNWIETVQLA